MKRHRNKTQTYCIGLIKASNRIILATSRAEISRETGLSAYILRKHLKKTSTYNTDDYCIWTDVPLITIERGFAR